MTSPLALACWIKQAKTKAPSKRRIIVRRNKPHKTVSKATKMVSSFEINATHFCVYRLVCRELISHKMDLSKDAALMSLALWPKGDQRQI